MVPPLTCIATVHDDGWVKTVVSGPRFVRAVVAVVIVARLICIYIYIYIYFFRPEAGNRRGIAKACVRTSCGNFS